MAEKSTGIYHELIIHPGVTIKEVLEDRNISQIELATKVGFSAKHVSEVISGKKNISSKFANNLEIALGIPASFWINLQANYDKKIIELENLNNISEEEYKILDEIKQITNYCNKKSIIDLSGDKSKDVLNIRKFLGITDLTRIPELEFKQIAYRSTKLKTNVYVLYTWQKLCEYYTDRIKITEEYDEYKLIEKLSAIRNTMFKEPTEMIKELEEIFASIGIAFAVVKHFTGAPVQGYIEKRNGKISLCMTIRQSYSDIFWFTLFHEIGHILNGDLEYKLIDYEQAKNDIETKADNFAQNILIDEEEYRKFIDSGKYKNINDIKEFAKAQNVIPSIVIGRINKELNDYSFMSNYRTKYKWVED